MSTQNAIRDHGPYDAITAMSVFCLWPATSGLENITEVYPFSTFESGLLGLFQHLKPGGVLLLQNAQYMVEDTTLADKLEPIDDIVSDSSGWIFKCAPNGDRLTTSQVDYDGRQWSFPDFFLANADRIKDTTHPIEFSVSHRWTPGPEIYGRNPDIALWRKIRE
ncbi:hypothetical protein ABI_22000 [Asticcacaulis biprosthecium C19]|uniref:Uncharacterized protein n=2 Tax=Asticcacaulis biprosthecium TaxID=76891 RepID=F4QH05_9CAUL|nr:hypothetical protein ABI_22000 [Asticcacaulis biprosthecium C19]